MTFPRTEAGIFAAAKERAAQPVGQSRIARVRVSRVSRLSRRAATTDLDGHVRTGSELPHGPREPARPACLSEGRDLPDTRDSFPELNCPRWVLAANHGLRRSRR